MSQTIRKYPGRFNFSINASSRSICFSRFFVVRAIPANPAFLRRSHGEIHLRAAVRHRIFRKFVAKIVQRKFQSRRKRLRVGNRFGQIGEKLRHFLGRFQMPLGIARQQAAGVRKIAMMADACKHIEQFALLRLRIRSAICGEQRQRQFARDFDRRLIPRFFFAAKMPLQFDVNIVTSKAFAKPFHRLRGEPDSAFRKRMGERALFATGQTNQALWCSRVPLPRGRLRLFCARNFISVIARHRFW